MYFHKKRYLVDISGGKGSINTDKLRGSISHLIIRPTSTDTQYDITILDKEGDEILEKTDWIGRMDNLSGLPLGKDDQEKLTVIFSNVSKNEPIKVIFRIKEI